APAAKAFLVWVVGKAGNGAPLTPRTGPKKVGDVCTSSSLRSTLYQRRVPRADQPALHRERGLGLSPPQGRAPQAWLRGLAQYHSLAPASAPHHARPMSPRPHPAGLPSPPRPSSPLPPPL